MARSGQENYKAALRAACVLAGLDYSGARLLHVRGNAVYQIPNDNVIVRLRAIPKQPGTIREQLTASLKATSWLCRHGYPAIEPLELDQPIAVDGHLATFWRYVALTSADARDLTSLGRLIRWLHDLDQPDIVLPTANPLGSFRADVNDNDAITQADQQWLLARADDLQEEYERTHWALGTGMIHGDAHAGNLLHTPDGILLGDWDSVSYGPREQDLVPTSMWYRYGRPPAEWTIFTAAYGIAARDVPTIPLLQNLRELQALAAYARNASDDAYRTELTRRITSLKTGDPALPWHAL
jgi:Ser/Thr protein kinase RdoA (MazF antagonist)